MSVEEILADDLKKDEEKQVAKTLDVTSRIIDLGKTNKDWCRKTKSPRSYIEKAFYGR